MHKRVPAFRGERPLSRAGASCELVTGAGVGGGTCAREFGGEALSRDGSPTKLRVCVGAALFVQKLHWFFYLAGAAALGYWAYSSTIKGQGVTPPTGATGTT